MVILHRFVEVIRPLVFEREDVEEHGFLAIDDALAGVGEFGFFTIQSESAVSNSDGGGGHGDFGDLKFVENGRTVWGAALRTLSVKAGEGQSSFSPCGIHKLFTIQDVVFRMMYLQSEFPVISRLGKDVGLVEWG